VAEWLTRARALAQRPAVAVPDSSTPLASPVSISSAVTRLRGNSADAPAVQSAPAPGETLAVGDSVWLLRPDGGMANVLEPWRIAALVDSPVGPLAVFAGRPIPSWPLAACQRTIFPSEELIE